MNNLRNWCALTAVSLVGHQVTQVSVQAAELAPASTNPLSEISGHFSEDINPSGGETAPLEKGTFDEGSLPPFAGKPMALKSHLKWQSDYLKLKKIGPLQGLFGHISARFNASIVRPTLKENYPFLDSIRSKDEFAGGLGYAYQSFRGLLQLSLDRLSAPTLGGSLTVIPLDEGNLLVVADSLRSGSLVLGIRGIYKDMLLIGAFAGCKVLGQYKLRDNQVYSASHRYSGMVWGFEGAFPAFKGNVEIHSKGQRAACEGVYIGSSNYAKMEACVEVGEILTWRWQSLAKYPASAFKVGCQFIKFKIPEIEADEVYLNGGHAEASVFLWPKESDSNSRSVFDYSQFFWTVSMALTNQIELKLFGQIRGEGLSRLPFGVNLNWQILPIQNRLGLEHHLIGGRRLSAREGARRELQFNQVQHSTHLW